jgi:hypothetical protein
MVSHDDKWKESQEAESLLCTTIWKSLQHWNSVAKDEECSRRILEATIFILMSSTASDNKDQTDVTTSGKHRPPLISVLESEDNNIESSIPSNATNAQELAQMVASKFVEIIQFDERQAAVHSLESETKKLLLEVQYSVPCIGAWTLE